MLVATQSGLVQRVSSTVMANEQFQNDGSDAERTLGADVQDSQLDAAATLAIPAVPTTEVEYDGQVAFGTFKNDPDLSGG